MRIIVNDSPGTEHAEGVKQAVIYGYNAFDDKQKYPDIDITDQVMVMSGAFSQIVDYAKVNVNVIGIVRSTSGIRSFIDSAKEVYPRVQSFVPMGSNNFYDIKLFTDPDPPVIVTCGCGDDEIRNNTAYGNGLEFWDTDWQWVGGSDASSFANGWIAGKMLRIYDEIKKKDLKLTWWNARHLMRLGCWRIEPNRQTSPWDFYNGYGRPNLDEALRLFPITSHIDDPYIEKLGEIGKIMGIPIGAIKLYIDPVKNAIQYNILKNGEIIKQIKSGHELMFIDLLEMYGIYTYKYYAIGANGQTLDSNTIIVSYKKGNQPTMIILGKDITAL